MATPIKRIEKDFLIKVLYDEDLPVIYLKDRSEFILKLEEPAKTEMIFRSDHPINGLSIKSKLDLKFNYRGIVISFTSDVTHIKDGLITCNIPALLYKDLDRSSSRVSTPSDMKIQLTFLGDRYDLSFPRVMEYNPDDAAALSQSVDPHHLSGFIEQMSEWVKNYASSYKLFIFKDTKPQTMEERIVAETGKTLFLISTQADFPTVDPYPHKRIITGEMFKFYLESIGVDPAKLDNACKNYIESRFDNGIYSEAWVPVLFQEYVIGYIHIWVNEKGKPPIDYTIIDSLYEFAKILAYSLKTSGYFEKGKLQNEAFSGKVIDISASGLLFTYPHSDRSPALLPDSELTIKIITPQRSVTTAAKIVRRFKDPSTCYFGCSFIDIEPEDIRFLFEYIYGKPYTDTDATFLMGHV